MSSYGSIILPKNVFKNVLPTIGSNFHIPNGHHKLNSVENENAPYLDDISVTSQHMKTTGMVNALVALFLSFKVKVTPWINGIGHCQPPASKNMPYLSDLS